MTSTLVSKETIAETRRTVESQGEDGWPVLTPEQKAGMPEEELIGILYQKVALLNRPGTTDVVPTLTAKGTLRYRVFTTYVDDRDPENPVRSAVGLMIYGGGRLRIEMRDFEAHVNGGSVLTTIVVDARRGRISHDFFDDAGDSILEKDPLREVVLDAHDAVDEIKAATAGDSLGDRDLTHLFRSPGLGAPGVSVK